METSLIFGLGTSGLFLGRQLAKNNINVIGIGRIDDIGLYSKYIKGYVAETVDDINNIIEDICIKTETKPKAYISSDQYLTKILYEIPELFDKLDVIGADKEVLKLINNKEDIIIFCEKNGILTPKLYKYDEIMEGKKNIEFPLIFKLNYKQLNIIKNPIGKIKIINNRIELENIKRNIYNSNINKDNIVIQSYISGSNASQFSFGGYFKKGKELSGIVVNQIRQYPQGVSSLVIETDNKNIEKKIKQKANCLAKSFKYTGFMEIEFKVRDDKIYLLDINPRPWGWVSILGIKYKNFHHVFNHKKDKNISKNTNLVMWKSPIRELIGYSKNSQNVRDLKNIYREKYSKKDIAYDIYTRDDIKPLFAVLKVAMRKTINKLFK
ncbi:MAG: hypothetical protein ACOCRO_02595 [Halanaerobiales bacterium]